MKILAAASTLIVVVPVWMAEASFFDERVTEPPAQTQPAADLAPWTPATTGDGKPLATWSLRAEPGAPEGARVLALTATNHSSSSAFNLCLNQAQRFKDGTFILQFRADAGSDDQGGGPIWRVQDSNNYYVCRANPLESNFRLYVVTGGTRKQLASVEAKHSTGMWHTIEVTHTGDKIHCTLDGRASVDATDATIPAEGGVGVWTKADARTSFVLPAAWRGTAESKGPGLDTAAIDSITGLKGTLAKDNSGVDVFKVTQGRTDVPITVEGRKMEPFMGFTSWAAFQAGTSKPAMMAGDLVVFQDEVNPVMDAFFSHGCTVTALHNHFFYEEPKTYFMHFGGEGSAADLAKGFRAALDAVKAVRTKNAAPASKFDDTQVPTTNAITAAKLDGIFFADGKSKGAVKDGMYKATVGRTVEMSCGCPVGSAMGINTWAGFCGNDDSAAVAGDFIAFKGELQPVLHALRKAGINVVTIHNHMEDETPASIFLHYYGKGRAEDLARGVKSALDAQAVATSK